jgi:hypothetical protein
MKQLSILNEKKLLHFAINLVFYSPFGTVKTAYAPAFLLLMKYSNRQLKPHKGIFSSIMIRLK